MADRYWVGGTATWDATAGSKWATTSGGSGGASVPTASDDVFFDANSGNVTVTLGNDGGSQIAKNLDFTGFTGTLTGNFPLDVWGSLTMGSGMTFDGFPTIDLLATSGTYNITTNGIQMADIRIVGGANYVLQDNFVTKGTFEGIIINNGSLDMNDFDATVGRLFKQTTSTSSISLKSGSLNLNSPAGPLLDVQQAGFTVVNGTGDVNVISDSTAPVDIKMTSGVIDRFNINLTGNKTVNFEGDAEYGDLTIEPGHTVVFEKDTTTTVGDFIATGTAGNEISISSTVTPGQWALDNGGTGYSFFNNLTADGGNNNKFFTVFGLGAGGTITDLSDSSAGSGYTPGTYNLIGGTGTGATVTLVPETVETFTLTKPSGTVNCDYLILKGSNATGGATWNAGPNSTDDGSNTGWSFTSIIDKSLTVTAQVTTSLEKIYDALKDLVATAQAQVGIASDIFKKLQVTAQAQGNFVRKIAKNLTVNARGTPVILNGLLYIQKFIAQAQAQAVITKTSVAVKTITAIAQAQTSIDRLFVLGKELITQAQAQASIGKTKNLSKALQVTAQATAEVILSGLILARTLIVGARATITLSMTKALSYLVKATAQGIIGMLKDYGSIDKYPENPTVYQERYPENETLYEDKYPE